MHWVFDGCMTNDRFGVYGALEVGISDARIFDKHLGFLFWAIVGRIWIGYDYEVLLVLMRNVKRYQRKG